MARKIPDTLLESVADVQSPPVKQRTPTAMETSDADGAGPEAAAGGQASGFQRYRPIHRPPMAMLCVLDDGSDKGEWIRVRRDRLVVGRSDGDLVIPHDDGMSGKHFEIVRVIEDADFRWYVKDLGSTNGTFAAIKDYVLRHNQELIIGGRGYMFNAAPRGSAVQTDEGVPERKTTMAMPAVSRADVDRLVPSLVEETPDGDGNRYSLTDSENFVGSDSNRCSVVIEGDPFVEPRHARIYRDQHERWRVEDVSSANRTWLRMDQIEVVKSGFFQAGEQRFRVKIL